MQTSAKIERDPTGGKATVKYGQYLQGAQYKISDIVNFHVGDMVTSLQKTALVPGGTEVLFYSTILGGLGMLMPFAAREVRSALFLILLAWLPPAGWSIAPLCVLLGCVLCRVGRFVLPALLRSPYRTDLHRLILV